MLLADDSPLLEDTPETGVTATEAAGDAAPASGPQSICITFEQAGPLGIEFERLAAPFVIGQVHPGGLAFGRGLERGDRLVTVNGEAVDSLPWEDCKSLLQTRPAAAVFQRDLDKGRVAEAGGGALLSGLAGRVRSLGGSVAQTVAQQGLDLTSKVGSVGLADLGMDFGGKVGNVGLADLGSKVGTVGLDLGSKVTTSLYSGLLGTVQGASSALLGADEEEEEEKGEAPRAPLAAAPAEPVEPPPPPLPVADAEPEAPGASSATQAGSSSAPDPDSLEEAAAAGASAAAAWGAEDDFGFGGEASGPAVQAPEPAAAAEWGAVDFGEPEAAGAAAQAAAWGEVDLGVPEATPGADEGWVDLAVDDETPAPARDEPGQASPARADDPPLPVLGAAVPNGGAGGAAEPEWPPAAPAEAEVPNGGAGGAAEPEGLPEWPLAAAVPTEAEAEAREEEVPPPPAAAAAAVRGVSDLFGGNGDDGGEDFFREALPATPAAAPASVGDSSMHGEGLSNGATIGAAWDGDHPLEQPAAAPPEVRPGPVGEEAPQPPPTAAPPAAAPVASQPGPPALEVASGPAPTHQGPESLVATAPAAAAAAAEPEGDWASRAAELEAALRAAEAAREAAEERCARLVADAAADAEQRARLEARLREVEAGAAEAADAADRRAREERGGFEAGLAQLRQEHGEETRRCQELAEAKRREEVQALQTSVEALRQLREQEVATHKGQLEQLRFALAEKEKQLAEKCDAISKKEEEIRSLLKQLATVPVSSPDGAQKAKAEAEEKPAAEAQESEAATTFEVMFALEGPLGLEFQRLSAPYVVTQVHANRVATGLGIVPGDELVAVAEDPVTSAPWEALVQRLSKRPVVARFRRDPRRLQRQAGQQEAGLLSSVSSVGSSLLTVARRSAAAAGTGEAADSAETARLQAESERLATLLRARDAEIEDLRGVVRQREEGLRLLEGGNAGAADAARLAQEKEALAQQLERLTQRLQEAQSEAQQLQGEKDRLTERLLDEGRQKEEHRQQAAALTERCGSLMMQFQTLNTTCQTLSLDSQQKAALESQVQELARMNAHWQQAHHNLTSESDALRQRVAEVHQLQAQVTQLRQYEQAYGAMERRLHEAERQLQEAGTELVRLQQERLVDQTTIQRLQGEIEAVQDSGESEAGHLEGELLERSRECAALRREAEEQRRKIAELLEAHKESHEAAEAGRALRAENVELQRALAAAQQEQKNLSSVVERCLDKMEKENRERPYLVDKRMVTQMVAAYLEQRDNPRSQQEILHRMADLLGFTTAEREQVGLTQKRRSILEQQEEPTGFAELTDRFVDFLLEESEGA